MCPRHSPEGQPWDRRVGVCSRALSEAAFPRRECEVFSRNHPAPFSKVITFPKKEPFELEAVYTHSHEVPYPDPRIGECMGKQPGACKRR